MGVALYSRSRAIVSIFALIVIIILGTRLGPVFGSSGGSIPQRLHWMAYGFDRVSYHNRNYINPTTYTADEVEQKFGQGEQFVQTGDKVIGLPVYDTPRSLAFQKQRNVVSTLLFLRKSNGDFIVYALSGGP